MPSHEEVNPIGLGPEVNPFMLRREHVKKVHAMSIAATVLSFVTILTVDTVVWGPVLQKELSRVMGPTLEGLLGRIEIVAKVEHVAVPAAALGVLAAIAAHDLRMFSELDVKLIWTSLGFMAASLLAGIVTSFLPNDSDVKAGLITLTLSFAAASGGMMAKVTHDLAEDCEMHVGGGLPMMKSGALKAAKSADDYGE